ncbi:cold shock domain-containing protein [Pseudanabaenaceae cyanobacterium LEGE 13415]|nr:cold shock domain-containing protein [Pseudanabaenaceae cyanobacterium LEGE 13415]
MSLDFGRVLCFKEKGFGFLSGQFKQQEAFFHITKIKDTKTRLKLKEMADSIGHELQFWYEFEEAFDPVKRKTKSTATTVWLELNEVPAETARRFAERIVEEIRISSPYRDYVFWAGINQLFHEGYLSELQIDSLMNTRLFIKSPDRVIGFLNDRQKLEFAEALRLEEGWKNTDETVSQQMETLTWLLLGESKLKELKLQREQLVAKANAQRIADRERQLEQLITKFRVDATGIRLVSQLRGVCIDCRSRNVQSKSSSSMQQCLDCKHEWYVNHCWNCQNGRIDSRDPQTPHCLTCGWHRCNKCAACKPNCGTN